MAIPTFAELIADTRRSADHLEMRDAYTPSDPDFRAWRDGALTGPVNPDWGETVRTHAARGVAFRRARVVSEPLSDYTAFEYDVAEELNLQAGEDVRWLPRHRAADLLLPALDCWILDNKVLRLHHFDGNGEIVRDEVTDDPHLVGLYADAFARIWERAVPHREYAPDR